MAQPKVDPQKLARLDARLAAFLADSRLLTVEEQKPLDDSADEDNNPQPVETTLVTLLKHKVTTACGDKKNLEKIHKLLGDRKVRTWVGRYIGHPYWSPDRPYYTDRLELECCAMIQCTPAEAQQIEELTGGSMRYDDYTSGNLPPKGFCWFENE